MVFMAGEPGGRFRLLERVDGELWMAVENNVDPKVRPAILAFLLNDVRLNEVWHCKICFTHYTVFFVSCFTYFHLSLSLRSHPPPPPHPVHQPPKQLLEAKEIKEQTCWLLTSLFIHYRIIDL